MSSLNRGIKRIGGWAFWVAFWFVILYTNVRREQRRHERASERARRNGRPPSWAEGEAIPMPVEPDR